MARPDLVEPEALNGVVDVCLREGNHDRQFWITDPLMDANEQQANAVTMACYVRSHVRMSRQGPLRVHECCSCGAVDPEMQGCS